MALDLPLPHCVYAHSFWISEGRKMSKSLGNFIDLEEIEKYIEAYNMDAWRYYLVTQGPLGSTDADFSAEKFHDVYNSHLVNTVGNCASRVTAMIEKYFDGAVPPDSGEIFAETDWKTICSDGVQCSLRAMETFSPQEAVGSAMSIVRQIDLFINTTAPFKLAKDESKQTELGAILYQCIEALRVASVLLHPVIPVKMDELHQAIGVKMPVGNTHSTLAWGGMRPGTLIQKVALFPRVELASSE
jgi:methionyl-tRNA synthetase